MFSKDLDNFLHFLRESELLYNIALKEENEVNYKTQDILHNLEIYEHSYNEFARFAKSLSLVRQLRRDYKDKIKELKPLIDWYHNNQRTIRDLEAILGEMRKIEKGFETRSYIDKTNIAEIIQNSNFQKIEKDDLK